MTPGIQPSNVKIRLRKKLAMRPVMSTATGGRTTQKKYRSAFIGSPSSFPALLIRPSATRNLQSPDSTANRDTADASAIRDLHCFPQRRSPCICRSSRCAPLACPDAASHHGLHCLADRAPPPWASQSLLPSLLQHSCERARDKRNPQETPLNCEQSYLKMRTSSAPLRRSTFTPTSPPSCLVNRRSTRASSTFRSRMLTLGSKAGKIGFEK